MSALDIKQIETVVNEIVAVAKGEKANGGLPYGDFTTCATTALQMDVNQINNGISQVLSRTIFSVRPYTALYQLKYPLQEHSHLCQTDSYTNRLPEALPVTNRSSCRRNHIIPPPKPLPFRQTDY